MYNIIMISQLAYVPMHLYFQRAQIYNGNLLLELFPLSLVFHSLSSLEHLSIPNSYQWMFKVGLAFLVCITTHSAVAACDKLKCLWSHMHMLMAHKCTMSCCISDYMYMIVYPPIHIQGLDKAFEDLSFPLQRSEERRVGKEC